MGFVEGTQKNMRLKPLKGIDPLLSGFSSDDIEIPDTNTNPVITSNNNYNNMLVPTFENKKNEIVKRLNERDIVRFRFAF